jgi:hypothetical protein
MEICSEFMLPYRCCESKDSPHRMTLMSTKILPTLVIMYVIPF